MHRQKTLPLDDQEPLEALWESFPEAHRRAVSRLYARLMAKAVSGDKPKEDNDDARED